MTTQQQRVHEFHRAFGCTAANVPTVPNLDDKRARVALIAEELNELSDAFEAKDLGEIADALGDLLYVVIGTAVCCGIDLEPVFEEIHRSNMTKLWTLREVQGIRDEGLQAVAVRDVSCDDQDSRAFAVTRLSDLKVMKSPSYSPANLKGILNL